ncbi:hypothetical protein GHT06_010065 [Daphnia sinensis]|uniref:Uncharacterized protein n=1 Tax=Daphnia sinensis TaxID=1820382 RepID=A0AAD5KXT4_9CRUS|nr:hypothetical protein GHT06_010065 [Daphnia sinensis]
MSMPPRTVICLGGPRLFHTYTFEHRSGILVADESDLAEQRRSLRFHTVNYMAIGFTECSLVLNNRPLHHWLTSPDCQTCDKKNQFGTCTKLSCPVGQNGAICEKRRCVKNNEQAGPDVVISSVTAGFLVLLLIILVGIGLWIRSRRILRQSSGAPGHKVSVPPIANSYLFRAPSTLTRLSNAAYNRRPPLPPVDVEDENPYEYAMVDFPEPKPQQRLINTTVPFILAV